MAECGEISEYVKCTITDMSEKVLEHIAAKYNTVRKGVKAIMGGKVLEYEAKTIKREGIAEGRAPAPPTYTMIRENSLFCKLIRIIMNLH